ncbi:MAG: ATP-binding protein [Pseudomonadota bacterium]
MDIRIQKLDKSLWYRDSEFELPATVRARIAEFVSGQGNTNVSVVRLDATEVSVEPLLALFDCVEETRFVGFDGIGPIVEPREGSSLLEVLDEGNTDVLAFYQGRNRDDERLVIIRIVASKIAYLFFQSNRLTPLLERSTARKQETGTFFYGTDPMSIDPYGLFSEDKFVISDNLRREISRNTYDFLRKGTLDKFEKYNLLVKRGVVLSGPPGTGKTVITRLVIKEAILAGINVVFLEPQTVRRRHSSFRSLFQFAARQSPVIVLIDDIDLFFSGRDFSDGHNVLADMLQSLDGVKPLKGAITLATTNHYEILDPALTRPGRFDVHIQMSGLDLETLERVIENSLGLPVEVGTRLKEYGVGRTFAEVVEVCNRYKLYLMERKDKLVWKEKLFGDVFLELIDEWKRDSDVRTKKESQ